MSKKTEICAIVAVGYDDVIGQNGSIPWHSSQDFRHFKNFTVPYPCIFGRTTYDNMPKKPLPNRLNIVCSSRYQNELKDGVFYASSLENAIDFAKLNSQEDKIFICGGSILYKYALEKNLIDVMYLTRIKDDSLEQKVRVNPMAFTRFPVNTRVFENPFEWNKQFIMYPNGTLPAEKEPVFPVFYKFVKITQNTK